MISVFWLFPDSGRRLVGLSTTNRLCIRLRHRYQHSGGFSDVKSRACEFVDNRGIILSRIREQTDPVSNRMASG